MEKEVQNVPEKTIIHSTLAYSYSLYFFGFLIGFVLDDIFMLKPFDESFGQPLGLFWMILASLFIFWAQRTSRVSKKQRLAGNDKQVFLKGPYRATRIPTHVGLTFLLIGFGIFDNLPFVILFAVISFVATKYTFVKKEEALLQKKYGEPYTEYKKEVTG